MNFDEIKNIVPKIYDASNTEFAEMDMKAIYFEGMPYEGKNTRVFAYLGIPDVQPGQKVPAVVLVHGAGETAWARWVKRWNERGYAAISMDNSGHTPDKKPHQWAGPESNKFTDFDKPEKDRWIYHAVADVILAHNILRNIPEIDQNKIGITGISRGAVVTSIVIGVDDRFAFGVPVYGCGYLYEAESEYRNVITMEKKDWDPSAYFQKVDTPILWLNSDHDEHFPISSVSKSYASTRSHATMCILPDLNHSQPAGEKVTEIFTFADSVVKGSIPLIKITNEGFENGKAYVHYTVPNGISAVSAKLYYNNDLTLPYTGLAFTGEWNYVEPESTTQGRYEFNIPKGWKRFYINIVDNRGNTVTSELVLAQ